MMVMNNYITTDNLLKSSYSDKKKKKQVALQETGSSKFGRMEGKVGEERDT